MSARRQLWLLFAICALAALVRVLVMARSGLWADEVFSLATATGHSLEHPAAAAKPNLGDFVELNRPVTAEELRKYLKHESPPASPARVVRAVLLSDTSPPLYYLLLYVWTLVFGTSDIALRLFSTVCSLACLPVLADLARRSAGRAAVIPTCVLFALSPLAIYYSTEGRMYSLLWLCVLATTWATLALYDRGGGIRVYALWVAASVSGFLTHYFFVFPWIAIAAFLMLRPGKLPRAHLAACVFVTVMMLLPWYVKLPESLGNWRITQGWLKLRPGNFFWLTAFFDFIVQFFSGGAHQLWIGHTTTYFSALILFAVIGYVMVRRLRRHSFDDSALLFALIFVAACAGPICSDLLQHTYMVAKPRYAIAALPAAYLLAGAGLACFRSRSRIFLIVLILLAWAPDGLSLYRTRLPWLPMREIAQAASLRSTSSDLMLVHSVPSGLLDIARYSQGPAAIGSWVPQLGNRRVPESIQQLAAGRSHIIFVKAHDVGTPAPEQDWLRANADLLRQKRLGGGVILIFSPKKADAF